MRKKFFFVIVTICITAPLFALDVKYAPIVQTALADIRAQTALSSVKGHVTLHVSSGNRDLDKQMGEEALKAFPNLDSKADTVWNEELYELTVKIYREDEAVFVSFTLTDFSGKKIIDKTTRAGKVAQNTLETIQHKTALAAKNEFESYLDSVFGSAGTVVKEANVVTVIVKPPKKPFVMPSFVMPSFDVDWWVTVMDLGALLTFDYNDDKVGWEYLSGGLYLGPKCTFGILYFMLIAGVGLGLGDHYLSGHIIGNLDFFIGNFMLGGGLGLKADVFHEADYYPFVRVEIGFLPDYYYYYYDYDYDLSGFKFYIDYNFGDNGTKFGLLYSFLFD